MIELELLEHPTYPENRVRFTARVDMVKMMVWLAHRGEKYERVRGTTKDGKSFIFEGFFLLPSDIKNTDATEPDLEEIICQGCFDHCVVQKEEEMNAGQKMEQMFRKDSQLLRGIELCEIEYDEKTDTYSMVLLSESMKYIICGRDKTPNCNNYMGCIATERYGIAGNDLSDGDFSANTWSQIVLDIQYYEALSKSDL